MVDGALRSFWSKPSVADPPRRVWRDWVLCALIAVTTILEGTLRAEVDWRVASIVIGVAVAPTMLWRRTHPLTVTVLVFGVVNAFGLAVALDTGEFGGLYASAFALVLPYALFRWGSGRDQVIGGLVMLAAAVNGITFDPTTIGEAIGGITVLIIPALLGSMIRAETSSRHRALEDVKVREREQLARELHDSVAHHVSAIAVQAQAGRAMASVRPDAALEVLGVIEEAASRTLDEMRSMVGTLRNGDDAEFAPQQGIRDIPRLAATALGGLQVDVDLTGPVDGARPALDSAVYRIAQESVTNAVRHAADASRVDVRVTATDDAIRLIVSDDGSGVAGSNRAPGYGLLGMAERAKLLGGTLTAGPDPAGGWVVSAEFPVTGATGMTIRVLVADDQDLVRTGLSMILDAQPGIDVVGQAADGREAVTMARHLRPDVCLFDIRMPELDGIEATRLLAGPGVADPLAVVVITTFDLDEYVHGALKAGAKGFLLKDAGPELLVQAIQAAARGDALIAPSITARLLEAFADTPSGESITEPVEPLTAREEEVVATVARGRTNAEIADELHISLSTVKTHLASLMSKLGARNRVEIAMWAYESRRV